MQGSAGAEAGWPGGIRQQFRVALPLVEGLLLRLKRVRGLEGRITTEMLDEGDCVGERGARGVGVGARRWGRRARVAGAGRAHRHRDAG